MKKGFLTLVVLPAAVSAAAVGIVHYDASEADTLFNYLAAVPAFNYADGGKYVREPLYADVEVPTAVGGVTSLWVIGDADKEVVSEIRNGLGLPEEKVISARGDVFAVAATLALRWTRAREVVVAPYDGQPDGRARTNATYAAALAAALNAPLLYTHGGWAPAATLATLDQLGTKRVVVVDFTNSCGEDALRDLAGAGRNVQVMHDAYPVKQLIRAAENKGRATLPADA